MRVFQKKKFDVISIGSATRDAYIRTKGLSILTHREFSTGKGACFPLGSKVEVQHLHFTTGGGAINTSISFARQGLKAGIVARVGGDLRGDELIRVLKREGVYTECMQSDKRTMTAYSMILLSDSGERTILVYRGATEDISKSEIPWKKLRSAKWLYISHLAGPSSKLFVPLIEFAAKSGIRLAINPGQTQLGMNERWWRKVLGNVDILILNREEASRMTRVPYGLERGIFKKLDSWVRGVVVMTEGPQGVWISDGAHRWHAGILKEKKIVDRTGAGDAFAAGFVAGFITRNIACEKGVCHPHEKDIEYVLQLASANATSQIEKIGAREGLLRKQESIYKWGKLKIQKTNL